MHVPAQVTHQHSINLFRNELAYFSMGAFSPSMFTPNGDGINDVIRPKGAAWLYTDYVFEIFTRWGNRVFRTSDPTAGWDGGFHESNNVPGTYLAKVNDVYYWKVRLTDNMGVQKRYEGHFMLLH
jgi:gliding motility-associated-like protein